MRRFTVLITTLAVTMSGLVISSAQADAGLGLSLAFAPTAQAKAKVTKPSAPTIAAISSSAVKKGKVNVKVTITLPASNGGSKITGSKVSAGGKSCTIEKTKTSCTIKSISNGKSLSVYANSKNIKGFSAKSARVTYAAGASPWSTSPAAPAAPAVSPVADAPAAAAPAPAAVTSPGAPTNVLATNASSPSVVSWTAPESNGGAAITSYTVTSTPGSVTCSTASSPCEVTGLTNGTTYTFTVTATNTAGTGTASTASSSVIPATCANGGTCVVGNTGPGGGIVYYVDTAGFNCGSGFTATGSPTGGLCNYLEAAPTTGASAWTDVERSWSTGDTNQNATVTNATGTAIGTGYKNSVAIVAQTGNVAATSAAVEARAYRGPNGLSDWFLPSKDELNQLYLQKTAVGGISVYSFYWSSSQYTGQDYRAADQAFWYDGGQGWAIKRSTLDVRPVRAFGLPCAAGGACVVGNTGPGGGIVYYVDTAGFNCGSGFTATGSPTGGECNYLEVAPSGWNTGTDPAKPWATGTSTSGNAIADVTGITNEISANNSSTGIGLGYKNSDLIKTQNGTYDATSNNYAAGAARAYAGNSKSDWYLPTTAELNLLCQWGRNVTQVVGTACTSGILNTGTGVNGGFVVSDYWSSSESTADQARIQYFGTGVQNYYTKYGTLYVRPVRAF